MADSTFNTEPQGNALQPTSPADLAKLQTLLGAKDDTQRFVGLALLKSVLDSSAELREDEHTVGKLWETLSPKFLDRLLRTGSKQSNKNSKEMLDLAVSVLHTFAILLPERAGSDPRFLNRIPGLVSAVLYSSDETTAMVLQLLHTLVSSPDGAMAFVKLDDISTLTEIAPSHAPILDILSFAWLSAMTVVDDPSVLASQADAAIQSLVVSFTGTDAVTLLEFLGYFLRHANPIIIPHQPKWLKTVVNYVQNLVISRPTPEARSAYTNAAAALLQTYQVDASKLLFTDSKNDEKPFSYLLINLLFIDIRSSAPTLLAQLNEPEYPKVSQRLASAFDIISSFVGYLMQSLEAESSLVMSPDNLLKLRKGISETMSVTIEYLRDRWDASFAGAMGLHQDAVLGTTETVTGSHLSLAWDSKKDIVEQDMFILSAVRALAIWLREDDNDSLRKETTGLMDMFLELYRSSNRVNPVGNLDFRVPILVALEGIIELKKGRESFLANEGWGVLTHDLTSIFQPDKPAGLIADASRATDIVRILLPIVEQESGGTPESWMDLPTAVAAWGLPDEEESMLEISVQEAQLAALQLCCAVLADASRGLRQRYAHTIGSIRGVAAEVGQHIDQNGPLGEMLEDVLVTLDHLARQS
ncbi:Neurochondrin-domain-containing protein [Dactylonectria estremocensis]|uniref:Neurochondrin-domain-containing protein n=1 Tax=Dactylonectria estremocensis TaxID=1079267 RepID=A0A9P9JC91_9HYPO|nr:Neurochondrin-domain-containing protein [Dactylonectria estremocensis]